MIKQASRCVSSLVAMITPHSLRNDNIEPVNVIGNYNWASQRYEYSASRFGTNQTTSFGTSSGQFNFTDDNNSDSYSD